MNIKVKNLRNRNPLIIYILSSARNERNLRIYTDKIILRSVAGRFIHPSYDVYIECHPLIWEATTLSTLCSGLLGIPEDKYE